MHTRWHSFLVCHQFCYSLMYGQTCSNLKIWDTYRYKNCDTLCFLTVSAKYVNNLKIFFFGERIISKIWTSMFRHSGWNNDCIQIQNFTVACSIHAHTFFSVSKILLYCNSEVFLLLAAKCRNVMHIEIFGS